MRSTAPTEGDDDTTVSRPTRRALGAALAIAASLTAAGAGAQDVSAALSCTPIEDDDVRLACYDSVLRPSSAPRENPGAAAAPAEAAPRSLLEAPARETRPPPRESAAREAPAASTIPAANAADIGVVLVVGMRETQGRALVFTTEDGASWVQTDSQRNLRRPEVPFRAEIREGAMSSRFLVIDDGRRSIRVRRAE